MSKCLTCRFINLSYCIGEAALQDLRFFGKDQCVIVSGESVNGLMQGAGKTEASKIFLRYIAAGFDGGDGKRLQEIEQQLIVSNSILEGLFS